MFAGTPRAFPKLIFDPCASRQGCDIAGQRFRHTSFENRGFPVTCKKAPLVIGLFVVLASSADTSHGKSNDIDISPCVGSFEALRKAELLSAEQLLREERARSAPRVGAIEVLEKQIVAAKTMSPGEYAKRHESPESEFYKGVALSSLNGVAFERRKKMRLLLANDVRAYRIVTVLRGSATPAEIAAASARDWTEMCILAARISATSGRPIPQSDRDLLRRFSSTVETWVQTAEASSQDHKSTAAVAAQRSQTVTESQSHPPGAGPTSATRANNPSTSSIDATISATGSTTRGRESSSNPGEKSAAPFAFDSVKECLQREQNSLKNACAFPVLAAVKAWSNNYYGTGYFLRHALVQPNRYVDGGAKMEAVACRYTGQDDTCTSATVLFVQACKRWSEEASPNWPVVSGQVHANFGGPDNDKIGLAYFTEVAQARVETYRAAVDEGGFQDDSAVLACVARAHATMQKKMVAISARYPSTLKKKQRFEY